MSCCFFGCDQKKLFNAIGKRNNPQGKMNMIKITEAVSNITQAYENYYNVNIALVVVPSEIFNPIVKAYRLKGLTLKEACTLLNQKISS